MYQHAHVGRSGFSDTTLCAFLFRLAVLCHNIEMNNDSCLVKLPPRSAPSASRASAILPLILGAETGYSSLLVD